MAKQKATHQGTCQCCGHFQKLPNGVLSNHGYTKKWGFFAGTCQGSGHLPFEQSCDLIKGFIQNAKNQIKDHEAEIKLLEKSKASKTWCHVYKSAKSSFEKSGYVWEKVEVKNKTIVFEDGTSTPAYQYAGLGYDDKEIIKNLNAKRANFHKGLIKQLNEYIEWQEERIKNWKPSELKPVVERDLTLNPIKKRRSRRYF